MSFLPCVETAAIVFLAVAGTVAGLRTARLKSPWWLVGFFVPMTFIALLVLTRWFPQLAFRAPFLWVVHGRTEQAAAAFLLPLAFGTIVPKLTRRRERVLTAVGAATVVLWYSVIPFLLPALLYGSFAAMPTHIDEDGVCIQHTSYTCGPAAAVTALRQLGLPAEEGELAILAHTSPIGGTDPETLVSVLRERYGSAGLACDLRSFESIDDLRRAGLTLAVVKLDFLIDHYVVVLEVTERAVLVGDPLGGKYFLGHARFLERWRRTGIVFARAGAPRKE